MSWSQPMHLLRRTEKRAKSDGKEGLAVALRMAGAKVEFSLRRQMAAALIKAGGELLRKEYLLDVGK